MLAASGSAAELEVDGGVKAENAGEIVAAGASILVAGSAIFNQQAAVEENIARIRRSIAT
jgi:ribulose-phosphate 3-epimerase